MPRARREFPRGWSDERILDRHACRGAGAGGAAARRATVGGSRRAGGRRADPGGRRRGWLHRHLGTVVRSRRRPQSEERGEPVDVRRFSADATAAARQPRRQAPGRRPGLATHLLGTGEWGLLADELAAALLEDATPIAAAERTSCATCCSRSTLDDPRTPSCYPAHPRPGAGARRARTSSATHQLRRHLLRRALQAGEVAHHPHARRSTPRTRGRSQPPSPQE